MRKAPKLPWADSSDGDGEDDDDPEEPREYAGAGYAGGPMWADSSNRGVVDPAYACQYAQGGGEQDWGEMQQQHYAYGAGGAYEGREGYQYGEGHTPTYEGAGMTLPGPAPGEVASIEFANSLVGPSGLGGMGAYSMTPFDHLHSIFAASDVSAAVLEEALVMSGWDVDQAIEYIIETQPQGDPSSGGPPPGLSSNPSFNLSAPPSSMPLPRTVGASGSRPLVVSRDSFDGYVGGNGGRGSPSGGPRWQSRPQTPTGDGGRGVGGRVCRYYLSGNCLRSDCKFSHDVGKAVCKYVSLSVFLFCLLAVRVETDAFLFVTQGSGFAVTA
jgi:hypothetical protein